MKCEDVWPNLETGGRWQRWSAKRHVRRCTSCTEAVQRLEEVRQQMAVTKPLPPELRERWLSAADSTVVRPQRVTRHRIAIAVTVTAASIALAVVLRPDRAMQVPIPPISNVPAMTTVEVSEVQVRSLDVSEELDQLLEDISRSKTEINELAEHIRLRQASDQLETLLTKYERQ